MPAPRDRRHIVLPGQPQTEPYKPWPRGGSSPLPPLPPHLRRRHATRLKAEVEQAKEDADLRRKAAVQAGFERTVNAITLAFVSPPGFDLELGSLESQRKGIELLSVQAEQRADGDLSQRAVVRVPDEEVGFFLKRFEAFATEKTKEKGNPKHQQMVQRIAAVRLATLRELWTDSAPYPADGAVVWWEIWLRRRDGMEEGRLASFAETAGVALGASRLGFEDRTVVLARATPEQLAASVDVLGDIAEARLAKESPSFFEELPPTEQAEWTADLLQRMSAPRADAPSVCVLDTGVHRGHPLLQGATAATDVQSCDVAWGVDDHHGHGTEMAGLALLGDLGPHLAGGAAVPVNHRLESVKILPPVGLAPTPPELYGARTAQASSLVEIQAPARSRAFLMAVCCQDTRDRGLPTSWSAAVDALASGRTFDPSTQGLVYIDAHAPADGRLFVLAAGNVDDLALEHLDRSDLEVVHDPGQAWNALTVGAFTERGVIQDPGYEDWRPVSAPGGLSPYSATSISFGSQWPLKPDVVFEGGNVGHNGAGQFQAGLPSLSLLTTYRRPAVGHFVSSWATSAAAAQAARMAARIRHQYQELWPETVRALIANSARWTPQMRALLGSSATARAKENLVRRFGLGVPDESRAMYSARDALTLVSQSVIRPFEDGALRELHFHALPWPREELAHLGEMPVSLRVTLSYFVEPNPGRRGWKLRHSYASHGLRFEVKGAFEEVDHFRARLNRLAVEEETERPTTEDSGDGWFLGRTLRTRGSLHSDVWQGTAADLAERGQVAVFPVSGWWKAQQKRDRSEIGARYALIVTIESPSVDVDIWTPVAQLVGVPVTSH